MRLTNVLVIAVLLVPFAAYANNKDSYREAEGLYRAGDYQGAEERAKRIVSEDPGNASYHQLLGDIYRKEGRLEDSIGEYELALKNGGENPDIRKNMGDVYKWMRRYKDASVSYRRAIELDPNDREAKEDLADLERTKGLRLRLMIGGWEPDYTTANYEGMVSYGGIDRFDLNAGYGYADQVYYKRSKAYANGYYFYNATSYFKVGASYKIYTYPTDPLLNKPNPDSNSYKDVPSVEAEVSHWFNRSLRGTLGYEYFRPNFFFDTSTYANNHKISADAYYITPLRFLRLELMYALLIDPDPNKTTIKGRNLNEPPGVLAPSTDIKYEAQSLVGGGIDIVKDKWTGDVKYIPNRDLDSSYDYSIYAGVGYEFTDRISGRLDYVHDRYSSKSIYSGKTADVYLVSVYYRLNPSLDLGAGYKRINLPTKHENTGFFTVTYRTGIGI
jgi:tetratricopeptide (TPR) repeat protein